jgi:hypothetical protein
MFVNLSNNNQTIHTTMKKTNIFMPKSQNYLWGGGGGIFLLSGKMNKWSKHQIDAN